MFEYAAAADGLQAGFAIVTGRFVTLFGHETGAEFAGELYALLENDEADLADVLDLLALEGGPPDCGIVEVVDAETRSVHVGVRGSVDVVMGGVASTRFSGPGGGAWVVGEAAGIDTLSLAIGDVPGAGDRLPVQRGVVRAAEIAMAKVRRDAPRATPDLATRPIELPAEPFGAEADELPARDGVPEASAPRLSHGWVVHLPDGTTVVPPVAFGRRPNAPFREGAVQIVTPSPRHEISGRHVEVVVDSEGISAVDLASTNGTIVRPPDRAPYLLIHNAQVALEAGTILDLGESYLVTIGVSGAAPTE